MPLVINLHNKDTEDFDATFIKVIKIRYNRALVCRLSFSRGVL